MRAQMDLEESSVLSRQAVGAYFLMLPDVHLMDMSGPAETLQESNKLHGRYFDIHYVGPHRSVYSSQGPRLGDLSPLPERVNRGDLVFVCGIGLDEALFDSPPVQAALQWLRSAHDQGAKVVGVCIGSFLLGEAGLLDGKSCTTHHQHLEQMISSYPKAKVLPGRIFVEDQGLYTSSGSTAGIDLTLHLIRQLRGANAVHDLVMTMRRTQETRGTPAHFRQRNSISPVVQEAQALIASRLTERITVESIAARCRVSPRHLQRLFRADTGVSVKEYLTSLRLRVARDLLQHPDNPVEWVAEKSGFHSTRAFRDAWHKAYDMSPSQARQRLLHETAPGPSDQEEED